MRKGKGTQSGIVRGSPSFEIEQYAAQVGSYARYSVIITASRPDFFDGGRGPNKAQFEEFNHAGQGE